MGSLGDKKGGAKVPDFLMSVDFGVCHGPVDSLNKVWIKDKNVLCGSYTEREDIPVNQDELFGGDDKEGGVVGVVEWYPGADDQVSSEALASRVGRVSANMPGYRGLAHLFLRGGGSSGFRWSTNNPYMPTIKAAFSRFPKTLTGESRIWPVANPDQEGIPETTETSWITFPNEPNAFRTFGGSSEGISLTDQPMDEYAPGWATEVGSDIIQDPGDSTRFFSSGLNNWTIWKDIDLFAEGIEPDEIFAGMSVEIPWIATYGGGGPSVRLRVIVFAEDGMGQFDFASGVDVENVNVFPDPGSPISRTDSNTWSNRTIRFVRVQLTFVDSAYGFIENIQLGWTTSEINYCDADNSGLRLLPNANPAHIIHEVLTNAEWGKGEDPTRIDTTSFTDAAQVFRDEFFGLAFLWVRQGTIEDFIQTVLDHTNCMLYLHPRTGLWTLKPLRDDYDSATVLAGRRLDETNCVASKRKRRAWGETINEIIVRYTDPQTEEDATIAAHNLANIAIQGGVISETRDYTGIRDEWLAKVVAERDVVESGHPLFSCEIECGRDFWDVVPGDVLAFDYPEDGITDMVVRVMKVNYGTPTDRNIKMSVVEDIFALEQTAFGPTQRSEWSDFRAFPEPLEYEMAMAVPLPMGLRNGLTLQDVDDNYPSVVVMLLGSDTENQAIDIAVHSDLTLNDGTTVIDNISTITPIRTRQLGLPLVEEATTTFAGSFVASLTLNSASQGDLLLIGDSEANQEIVMLGPYDTLADTWTVHRGIYDTIPQAWTATDIAWVFPEPAGQTDPSERAGETVTYRLLPRMSEGRLEYGLAADLTYTATERPHLPFRPANTQIDGNGFALADFTSAAPTFPINVTWSERNRATEDQVAMKWEETTVTPEAGQTTVIRVFDDSDVLAGEITGLTGTSYDMAEVDFQGVTFGYLEFVSERAGLRSRPGSRRWFDMRQGGYGVQYGVSYG